MKNENIKVFRDWLIVVALTVALLFASGAVPQLSVVCALCCGIPMAVLAAKYDIKVFFSAVVVVVFAYWPLSGHIINTVTTVILFVFPGMVAGYLLARKQQFFSVLVTVCAIIGAGWILEFTVLDKFWGISIEKLINDSVDAAGATISDVVMRMSEFGILSDGVTPEEFIPAVIAAVKSVIQLYFPAFIVVLSMLMGYITLRLSGFAIRKTKAADDVDIVVFSKLRAPRSMCYMLILAYLVSLFCETGSQWWTIIANIVFVLSLILGICGLSFVDFLFSRKIKSTVLRVLIYIGVVLAASFLLTIILDVLVLFAVLDSSRDFRRLENTEE